MSNDKEAAWKIRKMKKRKKGEVFSVNSSVVSENCNWHDGSKMDNYHWNCHFLEDEGKYT